LAKPEWGTKRICESCGAKFYDLRRDPILCPGCGTQYSPTLTARQKRSRARAAEAEAKTPATKTPATENVLLEAEAVADDPIADDPVDDAILEETDDLEKDALVPVDTPIDIENKDV